MLGVFLSPVFTRLGHECQDLLRLCNGMHRLELGLYSHPKELWWNGVRAHVNSKGKIPSTGKILLRGGSNPYRCIKQDSEPTTLPTSYSSPLTYTHKHVNWKWITVRTEAHRIWSAWDRLTLKQWLIWTQWLTWTDTVMQIDICSDRHKDRQQNLKSHLAYTKAT